MPAIHGHSFNSGEIEKNSSSSPILKKTPANEHQTRSMSRLPSDAEQNWRYHFQFAVGTGRVPAEMPDLIQLIHQLRADNQALRARNSQLENALHENMEEKLNFGQEVAGMSVTLVKTQRENEQLKSKVDEFTAVVKNLQEKNSALQYEKGLLEAERSTFVTGFFSENP